MSLLPRSQASLLIVSLILLQTSKFGCSQVLAPTSSQSNEVHEHNSHENTDKPGVHSVEDGDGVPAQPKKVSGNNPLSRFHNDNAFGAEHGISREMSHPKNHPDNRPFVAATGVSDENESQESASRKKREANADDVREFYNLTKIGQQALVGLLDVLNSTQKWKLMRIVSNVSLSKNQIEQQADAWVSNQESAVQEAYERYKQTSEVLSTKMQVIHSQIAQNLSAEAKQVDADLIAILTNDDLNMLEQCEEARAVLANTTRQVKYELETAFGPLPGSFAGHGRRAGGRGHNHRGHQRPFKGNPHSQRFGPNPFGQGGLQSGFNGPSNRGGRGGRLVSGGSNNNDNNQRGFGSGFEGGPQNSVNHPNGRFGGQGGFISGQQQGGFEAEQTGWAPQDNGGFGVAQPKGYAPGKNSYY